MAELEAEAFLLGHWKNFEELEEALNVDELNAVLDASRKVQFEQNKFLAALKGIKLDDNASAAEERFNAVKERVTAKQLGITEEEYGFMEAGLGFEIEDE